MKKVLCHIILLLICTHSVFAAEILKVAAPPSLWISQQGDKLTGPVIDFTEKIFSEYDIQIQTQALPWARAIAHIKSGKIDVIPVIYYTEERKEYMEFTVPYMASSTVVFVQPKKKFPFDRLEDLKGRHGLMMRDDSISPEFEVFKPQLNLSIVAEYEQMIKMLGNGRADYGVAAQYGLLIQAQKMGAGHMVEMLPTPVATRNLYFAFSKKSPFIKYLPKVNTRLNQLKADGTIDMMIKNAIRLAAGQ